MLENGYEQKNDGGNGKIGITEPKFAEKDR
jgi:hypothetical protein